MAFYKQEVLEVTHWNDTLFSFKTTRPEGLKFHNGHFVMLGLEVEGKPLMRAYSIASANYAEHLEFLSIKVPNGPLTSRLQHLQKNDSILLGMKPVVTLVIHDLTPAKNLYLFATGTGLAPFMSIIRDFETFERFDKIILVHGVRYVSELAYYDYLLTELTEDEYIGDMVKEKLIYYPTVTRESFKNQGRLTDLITNGKLCSDVGLEPLNSETDRAMICGSPSMLKDTCKILDNLGFKASAHTGDVSDYVIERSFVEK
ncbi:ferredoxin--NADP reductase [Colwellia sp. MB3u-4]|uniref:ferredoxin--NADP reductase n=1 Tax=Colwellia sp. MB3u-4 TaxID=2759822 RepID=UPI0015F4AF2B|nr:ferredoxin--NADP reductase [Colwellia sp. MB3u-4]MBA6288930.1 ferredoxin--NADP reductase [Colwellia sp. MB3u-4]